MNIRLWFHPKHLILSTKQLTVAIDFHSSENIMEVTGSTQLFGYPNSSKYCILCLTEERNSYMFGTTLGEKMTEFSFLGELSL